ncbi:MAG: hypothetical protein P8X50_04615 [Maritimibacter sp.]|jgi:uncharacterized protein YjiS (DUF1127 family)
MTTDTNRTTMLGHISTRMLLRRFRDRIRARYQARINRVGYRQMLELDQDLLRDIGLSRADVHWALSQPDEIDVGAELHAIRRRAS